MEYPNFYENLKEAKSRLYGTTVCYDGKPYRVLTITDHKPDGIFRLYLQPNGWDGLQGVDTAFPDQVDSYHYAENAAAQGEYLDAWMAEHPNTPILRKHMNSPKFNKFRPFPLGMCNHGTDVYYLARQPQRRMEQGLQRSAILEIPLVFGLTPPQRGRIPEGNTIPLLSTAFAECVTGDHPSAYECLDSLLDSSVENNGHAFTREMAFVRGPVGMILLAYRTDIVGVLVRNSMDSLKLGREYRHLREVIEETGLFPNLTIQQ